MNQLSRPALVLAAVAAAVVPGCAYDGTGSTDQEIRGGIPANPQGGRGALAQQGPHSALSMESRALLDETNTTSFEAKVGDLDSQIPPNGVIESLKLKVFDPTGRLVDVRQFQHVNQTSFAFALQGLQRGQPFIISARIVDAVTGHQIQVDAGDWVKLRPRVILAGIISPDFSVGIISPDRPGIISPDYVWRNQHVALDAILREINGDTGTHFDCVLKLDGAVVSTQPDVAIDSSGTARCHFDTVFTQTGRHTITVGVANEIPADYSFTATEVSQDVTVIGN